jgi:DNA-binding CsgD family transcriptional regulator
MNHADRCALDAIASLCGGRGPRPAFVRALVGRLCRHVGADGFCFSLLDPVSGLPVEVVSPFDDAARGNWLDAVFERSPLGDMGWLSRQPQRVQWAEQFVARPNHDPLIRNMLLPYEMRPMVCMAFGGWGYLNLLRRAGAADFGASEKRFLGAAVPMIVPELRRRAALELLGTVPGGEVGLVTLDPGGEIDAINDVGGALMGARDGGSFPLAVAVLGQLLRRAIREGARAPTAALPVVGATGERFRVRAQLLVARDGRRRGVVIAEPLHSLNDAATLAQLGLTRRERDVATMTMRGLSTQDAGTVLDMSPHTVEHHLGNLFGKLGVGSRAEMTALLLGSWETARPAAQFRPT